MDLFLFPAFDIIISKMNNALKTKNLVDYV